MNARTIFGRAIVVVAAALIAASFGRGVAADEPRSSTGSGDLPPRVPPNPTDRPPPGFTSPAPGVINGPPGSYGNAHNGLPNQSHGPSVTVSAGNFRPPQPGESATAYAGYIRAEAQRIWRGQYGPCPQGQTLHEGNVITYNSGSGSYQVAGVTCAPVGRDAHRQFAGATPVPGTPVAPPNGVGGYHMPCSFYGFSGSSQIGGCGVAAREWMGQPITFPQGPPTGISPVGRPPRPGQPPPPSQGPGGPTRPPGNSGGSHPAPPTMPGPPRPGSGPGSGAPRPPGPPRPPSAPRSSGPASAPQPPAPPSAPHSNGSADPPRR